MAKTKIKSIDGKSGKEINLPKQFNEPIRPDLIKTAVLAKQANSRQKYGAKPGAGMRASAELSRRRHDYRGSYGFGISRVPRKILSRRGTRMNWEGAVAPGTVGGRKAHPPKAYKEWGKKINKKERRKAIRSALSASIIKEIVEKRGHLINDYPLIIEDKFENLEKTKDVIKALEKLGLKEELTRCSIKKIRAGKGKNRGRKYKTRKGPLIVVSKDCKLIKSASNVPGIDIEIINNINAELLAPGTIPGRAAIYTEAAVKRLEEDKLFTNNPVKKPKEEKVEKKKDKNTEKKTKKTEEKNKVSKSKKKESKKTEIKKQPEKKKVNKK
jgi:large subunit ribosomal protein L4e